MSNKQVTPTWTPAKRKAGALERAKERTAKRLKRDIVSEIKTAFVRANAGREIYTPDDETLALIISGQGPVFIHKRRP